MIEQGVLLLGVLVGVILMIFFEKLFDFWWEFKEIREKILEIESRVKKK